MNGSPEKSMASSPVEVLEPVCPIERADWLSFWGATAVVLGVYLWTLPPEVTLEFSGLFGASALYAGVSHPPGYPLWTLYAWSFIKVFPWGNLAWRLALSSAVAGALTCGVVALLVTRGSARLLQSRAAPLGLSPKDQGLLRRMCGIIAGAGFGFHRVFWGQAILVETTALALLLLAMVVYLLWQWEPSRGHGALSWACLSYGLALTVHISLAAAVPGLLVMVLLRAPAVGRDFLFVVAVTLGIVVVGGRWWLPEMVGSLMQIESFGGLFFMAALSAGILCAILIVRTRRLLTHLGPVCRCSLLFMLGLSLYAYIPIASMSNPPVNWGYARSVEGWGNLLGRGQYERTYLDWHAGLLLRDSGRYIVQTVRDLGLIYVLAATVPLVWRWRWKGPERRLLWGLLAIFLSLSLLLLAGLRVPSGRTAMEHAALYFPAPHLVLAILTGYGLVLIGTVVADSRKLKE